MPNNDVRVTINDALQSTIDRLAAEIAEFPFSGIDVEAGNYNSTVANIAIRLLQEHIIAGGTLDDTALITWQTQYVEPTYTGSQRIRLANANLNRVEPIGRKLLTTTVGKRADTGRGWNRPLIIVLSIAWLAANYRSILTEYIRLQRGD